MNLIVFDSRHRSVLQCAVCQRVTAYGYRIVCIGAAGDACASYSIPESDVLSAILTAARTESSAIAAD